MRCKLVFILAIFIFYCATLVGQQMADRFFHPDSLRNTLAILAADSMNGRLTGSKEEAMAADFISKAFKKAGLQGFYGRDSFYLKFQFMPWIRRSYGGDPKPINGTNVIGVLPGKSKADEIIIFCSHYDHVGNYRTTPFPPIKSRNRSNRKDNIYNGANDNATGTAAVIALANYFASKGTNERTILFITFSGEEFGLQGSHYFVRSIEPEKIKAVVNIEMIGRGLYSDQHNPYVTGYDLSDLSLIINSQIQNQSLDSAAKRILFTADAFPGEQLFGRSDNYPFARKGIPAHTFMLTMPSDPFYHSVSDDITTIDFDNMSLIIRALAAGSIALVDGTVTPSRIDTEKTSGYW